jgi:hypothetical protein
MACQTLALEQQFRATVRPYLGWNDATPRRARWEDSPIARFALVHGEEARGAYLSLITGYARSEDENDRILARAAMFALTLLKTHTTAERKVYRDLINDPKASLYVRISAAEALDSAGGEKARASLAFLLDNAVRPEERLALLRSFVERRDPAAIPALREARDREAEPDVRRELYLTMELLAKPGLCVVASQQALGGDEQMCLYRCSGAFPVMRFPQSGQCAETWPDLPDDKSAAALGEQARLRQLFEEAVRQQLGLGRDVADPSDDSQWPLGRFRKSHPDAALSIYFDELDRHKELHGSSAEEADLVWAALDGIERLHDARSAPRLELIAGDLRYEVARIGALRVLATLPGQNKVETYGRRLLAEPDPTYREMIATILGEDKSPAAVPYLEKALLTEKVPAVKTALRSVRRGLSDPDHCFLAQASSESCAYSCLKKPFSARSQPSGGLCAETIPAP